MQFRLRLSTVGVLLALSLLTIPGLAGAQDPAGSRITLALGALPEVESYEVDDSGHLVELAGRLTQVGPSPPHRVAVAFLEIHRNLYPKAPGTNFTVESMTRFDGGSVINVRQWVGGFEALGNPVACRFDVDGVLVGISGVVLHRGDVAPAPEHPITEDEAYDVAVAAAWPGNVPVDKLPFLHSFAGTRVLHESQPRQAAWRVEMVEMRGKAAFRFTVMVDAATGAALSVEQLDVTPMLEYFPGQGQTAAESPEPPVEAKALHIDPGPACQEADPANPPGDFTAYQGFTQWTATRFETWRFKVWSGVTEFQTHLVEEYLIQRSHISRNGVPTPAGYTRLTFRFPDLSDTMKIKVCWGAMEAHCATLLGVEPVGPNNPNDTLGTFVFDDNDEWKASTSKDLVAYFTRSPLGNDSPITGDISRIELWSGPLLEFNLEPRLLNTYGDVPHSYGAGAWMTVNQSVFNAGCDMYETYSSNDIRAATYTLYKIESNARVPGSEIEACSNAMATGTLQSGMSAFLNMCNSILPEAGLNDENVGLWELEGVFDTFPQGNPPAFRFELLDHGIPNLTPIGISVTHTDAGGDPVQPSWLMRDEPYDISVDVRSQEYPTEQPVTVQVWASSSADWTLVGEVTVPEINAHSSITFPDVTFGEEFLPSPTSWCLLDIEVRVDPRRTVDEFEEFDNTLSVGSWIPLTPGALDDALGEEMIFSYDEFEDGTASMPNVLYGMVVTPMGDYLGARPEDGANERSPLAVWIREGASTVDGVMVRYRRDTRANREPPHLDAGWSTNPLPHYSDMPLDSQPVAYDDQWHTMFWEGPPEGGTGTTGTSTHLLLGMDADCWEGYYDPDGDNYYELMCIDYPSTTIDFIRAWGSSITQILIADFFPVSFVYFDDSSGDWAQLDDQGHLPEGTPLKLGLKVGNEGGESDGLNISFIKASITLQLDPPQAALELTPAPTEPASVWLNPGTTYVIELDGPDTDPETGADWVADPKGVFILHADTNQPGDPEPPNDSRDWTIYVTGPCETYLAPPAAVTEVR